MHLIVGLGNPGKKYLLHRHNAGFMVLDSIIKDHHLKAQSDKFNAEIFKGSISEHPVIAVKPQSFMNNSGQPVSEISHYYKIPVTNIIIIYDEMNIALGRVDSKIGGTSGTHNGLKSINAHLADSYIKIRVGIDRPAESMDATSHVLNKFTGTQLPIIKEISSTVSELLHLILENKYTEFQRELQARYPKKPA